MADITPYLRSAALGTKVANQTGSAALHQNQRCRVWVSKPRRHRDDWPGTRTRLHRHCPQYRNGQGQGSDPVPRINTDQLPRELQHHHYYKGIETLFQGGNQMIHLGDDTSRRSEGGDPVFNKHYNPDYQPNFLKPGTGGCSRDQALDRIESQALDSTSQTLFEQGSLLPEDL